MPFIPPINSNGPNIKTMTEAVVSAEMAPLDQALERREKQLSHEHQSLLDTYQAIINLKNSALWLSNEALVNQQGNQQGGNAGRWHAESNAPDHLIVKVKGFPDAGTYQVKIQQLASPQILVSPPLTKDSFLPGSGNLHIALNGSSWTVNLLPDSPYSSIARSIQLNTRGKIRGTIISGLDGERLLLTGAEKGAEWRIQLTGKGAGEELANMMTEQRAPADALVAIDDVELRLPGNIAQSPIRGLSFDLMQADNNQLIAVNVSQDIEPMVAGMADFVENCNQLLSVSDPRDGQGRQINADAPSSLRNISVQLKKIMNPSKSHNHGIGNTPVNSLLDLGISTERNGNWSLNESLFRDQLEFAPNQVLTFLTDPGQPVMMIASHMKKLGDSNSSLTSRATYLSRSLQKLSEDQRKLDTKRQMFSDRTMREFIRMDQNMNRFNRTRDNIENAYKVGNQQ